MKFADEYYQYLDDMKARGKIDSSKDYTEWLEEELYMEWEVHGYPYSHGSDK
ncbi:MAG: hypothetical protein RI544_07865 [Haloquadratum sp.]|nr:hypothetical protein [Haloferacaceae archaeon]MDR9446024.1 hypothetical protein [Haloquadratum sp.]